MPTETETILAATQLWLEAAVIGLNLCPFAKAVHVKKQIRYVVSTATTPEALLENLLAELRVLQDADPEKIDTTLLIHPYVLNDFLDFNDFLDTVDIVTAEAELRALRRMTLKITPIVRLTPRCICCAKPAWIVPWRHSLTRIKSLIIILRR
jgi:hypothetical protein